MSESMNTLIQGELDIPGIADLIPENPVNDGYGTESGTDADNTHGLPQPIDGTGNQEPRPSEETPENLPLEIEE